MTDATLATRGLALKQTPAPGAWAAKAACRGEPTYVFFPDDPSAVEIAKGICRRCAVRAECADYAMAIPSLLGIWGGLTERERDRLRARRNCRRPPARTDGGRHQQTGAAPPLASASKPMASMRR